MLRSSSRFPQSKCNHPSSMPDMMTAAAPVRARVICAIQSCVIKSSILKESHEKQQYDFNIQKDRILNIVVQELSEKTGKMIKAVGELTYNL